MTTTLAPAGRATQATAAHGSYVARDDARRAGEFLAAPPAHKFRQLLAILRLEPRALTLVFFGTVVASLLSLTLPMLSGRVVAVLGDANLSAATPYVLALAGIGLFAALLNAGVDLLGERAGNRTVRAFRDESALLALRVPADKLVDHPAADLVARCSIDSEHLSRIFSNGPIQAMGGLVLVTGSLVQMTILDPVLTGAALGLTVFCLGVIIVVSQRLTAASFERQEAQGAFVAELTRALDSVLTLRAFVADAFAARRLRSSSQVLLDASHRSSRMQALMGPMIAVSLQLTLLGIIMVAVLRVQAGALSVDELVSFIMFTMLIVGPIMGSADTVVTMAETLGAVKRLIELRALTTPRAAIVPIDAPKSPVVTPSTTRAGHRTGVGAGQKPEMLRGDVDFRNVSVKYPHGGGSREFALADVTFSVPAGSWVALTGTSGSGKSTVLSLLEKFVTPSEGLILVDGSPLTDHEDDAYRRQVGYIEQACPLFSGTVRDNLLLGREIDDEQCWQILEHVGLVDTIRARDGGLDAPVGESAYAFSGGERQRLAIARTLLGGPRMLLLDEITSGLDNVNRDNIVELIRTTMGGLTTFASSHGGVGIDVADLVLVLEQGRLVEFGPPNEVRRRSAHFRSLLD